MRLAVLILTFGLGSTLGSGVAWAFDCASVSLPSSIVICSDPDLMRIADERQEAVYEAQARLTDELFRVLMADQARWVRTYPTACGVPPEGGPPRLPVSPAVKECFGRTGLARTAYIRSYGLAALSPPAGTQDRIGPGFDCGNAVRPLALMICADAGLSRVDLQFNQAYWALLHQLDQSARQELRQEDIAFIDTVQDDCDVPRSGGLTAQTRRARDCVSNAYEGKRTRWLSRLSGAAFEEATRPAERHMQLQRGLGVLGFLPPAIRADGVYGAPTRNAIMAWQTGHGRTATGFLGEADARAIEQEAFRGAETVPVPPRALPGPRDEIPLSRDGGVFVVPVRINDAITLPFTLDSGASDVFIPAGVARTIDRTGTILDSDILGTHICTLADGSEIKCQTFRLRELRLGNHVVRNVVASVGPPNSNLLLGQSFLSRFGAWTIDNARSVLVLQSPNVDQPNLYGAQR
jgi:clan AA aspartic protease (TIGR02281 family)